MYCRNCGRKIEDGFEYCDECEKKLNEAKEEKKEEKEEVVEVVENNNNNNNNSEESKENEVKNENTTNTTSNNAVNPQAKSKVAAGIFAILLGAFGVHNFYLGFNGKAVAQLLMTVLSCGILSPVSALWALIEGILILTGSQNTDADGVELKE